MVQRTVVILEDDLDGSEASETIQFAIDGVHYEIDLSDSNAESLRAALEEYATHARRIGGRRISRASRSTKVDKPIDPAVIRAWAAANGIQVSNRGRVSRSIVEQYKAARN